MEGVLLEPTTTHLRLDERSLVPSRWRGENHFSITRLESTSGLGEWIQKSSSISSLLVSMSIRALAAREYRLWVDGKVIPTGRIPAFRSNVIDFAAGPACWAGGPFDYVHFHVPRGAIDEMSADLGYDRAGAFRVSVVEDDLVLAQITKSILPYLGRPEGSSPLPLDHLQLILGAHLLQHYGGVNRRRSVRRGGLAAWQRRRVEELLRENLDGRVRLANLARECELSVSHFARSFKASFGVTCHQWLTERRVDRAKELLALSTPLVDVASHAGFSDQASFTRTFDRLVGMTPGQWRREHARRLAR
jgi:AraC-like DNA-binding protein